MVMSVPSEPSGVSQHRAAARQLLNIAVLTVSDTRTLENDASGDYLSAAMTAAGHCVLTRQIVPDDLAPLRAQVIAWCDTLPSLDAILVTGGTGVSPRDITPEAIEPLLEQRLPGFGELFRMLSYQEIGPAAMLSRAFAGRIGRVLLFCLPGSTAAVRLATDKLLVPELPHLVHHTRPRIL